MFTGIIEEIGHVNNVKKGTASAILTIQAEKVLEGTHIGDSIAVNGVCLTGIRDKSEGREEVRSFANSTNFSYRRI